MSYEISTYVAGDTLYLQRNKIGNRAARRPFASCPHDRFCLALGEAVLRHLETGVPARLVESLNGQIPPRRRLSTAERSRIERGLKDLLASEQELMGFLEQATDHTRPGLESILKATQRQIAGLRADLEADNQAHKPVEPYTEVKVETLFRWLHEVIRTGQAADDLRQLVDVRIRRVEPLRLCFEATVTIPDGDGDAVALGPVPFSVERTTRLPAGQRAVAMAKLCLDQGWPASVAATGVPFVCAGYSKSKVALEIARMLRPLIGSKAAGLVAWSEIPEVIAVVARHLGLGKPELDINPVLEERIVTTYIEGPPRGPKAWPQVSDDHPLVPVFRQVHSDGEAPANGVDRGSYWCREGWLKRQESRFVRQSCSWCGSPALAVFAVPEVHGLICLDCRRDRTGLAFPEAWNAALLDQENWRPQGYDISVPPPLGLFDLAFDVQPLRLR